MSICLDGNMDAHLLTASGSGMTQQSTGQISFEVRHVTQRLHPEHADEAGSLEIDKVDRILDPMSKCKGQGLLSYLELPDLLLNPSSLPLILPGSSTPK